MEYSEIDGDLIVLAKRGKFDVIAHGCNCMSIMSAGIAPKMAMAFGCNTFKLELIGRDINKLGNIDYEHMIVFENGSVVKYSPHFVGTELYVVNAYTQVYPNVALKPFDYEAFTIICRKMNSIFKGKHIGLPQIGAGLAGGSWQRIKEIIQKELKDCKVTVVIFKK